jgi:hypothetical protein
MPQAAREKASKRLNPYEAPGCQETNHPYERFFLFLPLTGSGVVRSQSRGLT